MFRTADCLVGNNWHALSCLFSSVFGAGDGNRIVSQIPKPLNQGVTARSVSQLLPNVAKMI